MNQLVRVISEVSQKYIVAKVTDDNQIFLWGNPKVEWHKDIAAEMELAGFTTVEVIGGGKIRIETISKTIYVWGKSSAYGEVSLLEVKNILNKAYPDFHIVSEIPSDEKF